MHDRNGNPVKVGDRVNVPCIITSTQDPQSAYCNVTLATEEPMNGSPYTLSLNARQVELRPA